MRLYSEETYSPGFRRQIGELGGGDSESASGNSEDSTVLRERQERRETCKAYEIDAQGESERETKPLEQGDESPENGDNLPKCPCFFLLYCTLSHGPTCPSQVRTVFIPYLPFDGSKPK